MQRFWFRIAPYWHIGIGIVWAFIVVAWWVQDVNGYGGRIASLEAANTQQTTTLAVITDQVKETREQVHDIWSAMRLDRVKK